MFTWIKKIQTAIDGYKIYILGVSAILGIIVAWAEGAMGNWEAIQSIWAALVAMGFRSAIGKAV